MFPSCTDPGPLQQAGLAEHLLRKIVCLKKLNVLYVLGGCMCDIMMGVLAPVSIGSAAQVLHLSAVTDFAATRLTSSPALQCVAWNREHN